MTTATVPSLSPVVPARTLGVTPAVLLSPPLAAAMATPRGLAPAGQGAMPTATGLAAIGTVIWLLDAVSVGLSVYHGYRRHNGSIGWGIGWGLLGGIFPIIVPAVAFAQGFGKPMGSSKSGKKSKRASKR